MKTSPGISDISQSTFDRNKVLNEIEQKLQLSHTYSLIPKKIWSGLECDNNIDTEEFFDECVQVWPFNKCTFVKEIALEFLMKNKYSKETCLKRMSEFVLFMKKRELELDIPIHNKTEKTIKKYSLRKTK